jgi:hypothetical protein
MFYYTTKIQYISDIHLEHLKVLPYIKRVANNLCLLGDIGSPRTQLYKDFIKECSLKFKNVFIIYGNHEYHSVKTRLEPKMIETMASIETHANDLPSNVYFLNNSCVYLDIHTDQVYTNRPNEVRTDNLVKIIGSTLWAATKDYKLNDYKKIFVTETQKLTPEISVSLFEKSIDYIIREIKSELNIRCVLMTHHGTNVICNGNSKHKEFDHDTSYVTHIQELLTLKNLFACLNGHTHSSINEEVIGEHGNRIRFFANCYGYISEDQTVVKYNPYASFGFN